MIVINEKQKETAVKYVPNAAVLLQSDDVNDFLLELNDIIIDKGMDKDYELNDIGLKLQQLYDEVLYQNDG